MKNIFKILPGLLLLVVVSCGKSQKITISNTSSSAYYVMNKHTADHINAEKLYSLKGSGEIEHVSANGGKYTYVGHGNGLTKYVVDSSYVFCFVKEDVLSENVKGKNKIGYEAVSLPAVGSPDLTEIDIAIKDTLNKPLFTSSLKIQSGF